MLCVQEEHIGYVSSFIALVAALNNILCYFFVKFFTFCLSCLLPLHVFQRSLTGHWTPEPESVIKEHIYNTPRQNWTHLQDNKTEWT